MSNKSLIAPVIGCMRMYSNLEKNKHNKLGTIFDFFLKIVYLLKAKEKSNAVNGRTQLQWFADVKSLR